MPFDDYSKMSITEQISHREIKEQMQNGSCESCESTEDLTIHHIDSSPFLMYEPTNIVILCKDCHELLHEQEKPKNCRKWKRLRIHKRVPDLRKGNLGEIMDKVLGSKKQ